LAALGHVGGAKVEDGGDAGEVSDDGAVAELESGGGFCAKEIAGSALMKDGLAVVADEVDFSRRDAEFFAGR